MNAVRRNALCHGLMNDDVTNLKRNEAPSACAESTHKGVN